MEELFGLSMNTIMVVLLALFSVSVASVVAIFLRSGHMFRMGLRNIPRRGVQSGLVIVGLMLATLITTASFTTGDTIDHSITKRGYERLQRIDLHVNLLGENDLDSTEAGIYINDSVTGVLEQRFAGDEDIEAFIPVLLEPAGAVDQRSLQSEASIIISGIDPARQSRAGGLRLSEGGRADLAALAPDEILLSERGAEKLDARVGDTITLFANGTQRDVVVKAIVEDEIVTSGTSDFYEKGSGGGAMLLSSVQEFTGHPGQINGLGVALYGELDTSYLRSDSAISRLEPFLQSAEGRAALGLETPVTVTPLKADTVELAEEFGNLFTTFFIVLGLFSVAAGIMLIFMIFVMLAAERKPEMGMARAVGAQRSSLIQAFLSEGMAYTIIAGGVGAIAGVAAAVGLVAGFLKIAGGFDFLEAHITVRSLVISYCLGVVVTFLTVVFSSLQVSSVNIVAAIRGIDDEDGRTREKRRISWRWMLAGLPAMIVPPLGVWFFFRKGLGIAWTWIVAPIGLLLGGFAIMSADSTDSQFLFSFGASVLPLCVAMIASRLRAPARATWTLVGIYLAALWLAPVDYAKEVFGHSLAADIEMFVLSGVMVVIACTLIIVFNARLLTVLVQHGSGPRYLATVSLAVITIAFVAGAVAMGDSWDGTGELLYLFGGVTAIATVIAYASSRFPRMAPALKMGIAYPLANRFRTGMAIAMFSLIIFSLTTFGAVNASFVSLLKADGGDGGWDVMTTANRNAVDPDLGQSLAEAGSSVTADIASIGSVTIFTGHSQARGGGIDDYKPLPVLGADDAFFRNEDAALGSYARGYENEQAVFAAVASDPSLALVDFSVMPGGFNDYDFQADLEVEDDRFESFQLQFIDSMTGAERTVTVVGALAMQIGPQYTSGIYVNEAAYREAFGEPKYLRSYVKLNDGVNSRDAARQIEAALVTEGVQAESTQVLLDEAVAENNTFIRMFQGFMGLGLFTGVAALGVIAFRSVTERRQQIGMLRAIGYQAESISLSFMLESGFIALMGILSGVVGGMIIARNLFTSGQFAGAGSIQFTIPWIEVLIVVGLAFVVSMFMTWWPSRQASLVPVADALRYE